MKSRDLGRLHHWDSLPPSSGGKRAVRDYYAIVAKISCVVVDSDGVGGRFIDSALK